MREAGLLEGVTFFEDEDEDEDEDEEDENARDRGRSAVFPGGRGGGAAAC